MPDKQTLPPQHQSRQPGIESQMHPAPVYMRPQYRGSGKLAGKVAMMANCGAARAIRPYHTTGDGDQLFAASTRQLVIWPSTARAPVPRRRVPGPRW